MNLSHSLKSSGGKTQPITNTIPGNKYRNQESEAGPLPGQRVAGVMRMKGKSRIEVI